MPQRGPDILSVLDQVQRPSTAPAGGASILSILDQVQQKPTSQAGGLLTPGTLDPFKRPALQYPEDDDGSTSSVSFERDGKEILIPTTFEDTPGAGARRHSVEQSIKHYDATGQHLGIFGSADAADAFAKSLDAEQQRRTAADAERVTPETTKAPTAARGTNLDVAKSDTSIFAEPFKGIGQAVTGVRDLATSLVTPPSERGAAPTQPDALAASGEMQATELPPATKKAVNDVIEGVFKAGSPTVAAVPIATLAAGLVMPAVVTAISLGLATGADKAAQDAVKLAGGDEESQRLAGNIAAALAAGHGTDYVIKQTKADISALAERGRAARERQPAVPTVTPQATDIDVRPTRPISGEIPAKTGERPIEGRPARPTAPPAPEATILDALDTVQGRQAPAEAPATPVASTSLPTVHSPTVPPGTAPLVPESPGGAPTLDQKMADAFVDRNRAQIGTPGDVPNTPEAQELERQRQAAVTSTTDAVSALDHVQGVVKDLTPPKDERDDHSYSSTQVNLPADTAERVVAMAKAIPDTDIGTDGRAGDSEGSAPHVTVKYGLHTTDVEKVRKVLANEPPVTVTLGKTSLFSNDDADVLKIDVDSPDLHRLNAKIAKALETTDTHPEYKPHVTIAYLKPGKGKDYAGDDALEGHTVTLDSLRFSTKDGKIYAIPLNGPSKKPVTPQLPPAGGGDTYVLPSFVTAGAAKGEPVKGGDRPTQLFAAFRLMVQEKTLPKDPRELRKVAEGLVGGDAKTYTDDITDAVEAALSANVAVGDMPFKARLAEAHALESQLPRAHRSLEKTALQQFSTPLPIAVAAQHAAGVRDADAVLEPTAGTGHLIATLDPKARTIVAAELSGRRASLLRALGYTVQEGDYLKNLDLTNSADVIITNPPWGKYSTGKYGKPIGLKFTPGDVAERFIAKNVRDLKDGGRLVAVMPTTMFGVSSARFRGFLKDAGRIVALVKSPPGSYRTRSTDVESVLLVWDKGAKGDHATLIEPAGWEAYATAIEAIPPREDRRAQPERSAEQPTAGRPTEIVGARAGSRSADVRRPTGRGQSGVSGQRGTPVVPAGRDADVVATQPSGERRGLEPQPAPARLAQPTPGESTRGLSPNARDAYRRAQDSPFFAPYRLRSALGGVRHPKLVVEARNLAGIDYPPLTLAPTDRVRRIVESGRASIEQAEQAMAVVQANIIGHHGYLAADNVGVGKSREIALTIIDLMERAKANTRPLRLLVTTKSADNINDLLREMKEAVLEGEEPGFEIVRVADLKASKAKATDNAFEPLPQYQHAIYVTDFYNLAPYRAALQEVGLHGVIGDEAHRFKNADAAVGGTWQTIHAAIMLRQPREQQVFGYFSATPAQSVYDYQYLYGLRLWPIDGFHEWVEVVTGQASAADAAKLDEATEKGAIKATAVQASNGEAVVGGDSEDSQQEARSRNAGEDVFASHLTPSEAEQIPREWKMLGRFSARDLWREGTEFQVHTATLPEEAKARYDTFAALARDIIDAASLFGKADKSGRSNRFGPKAALQAAAKRIQMQPALEEAIRLAHAGIADGYQVVLSVINVSEMDPNEGNIAAAINQINTREVEKSAEGFEDVGEIPEALVRRAELLEQAQSIGTLPDPIEMIGEAFGRDNVAFIVGASAGTRQAQAKEFQDGKRKVAVISAAGSTGISLDHRTWTKGGVRGRRLFIDVQYEWSASEAVQRYGRVDRAAQLTAPKILALNFGSASEKKFLATVANRMASLGALSKGGAESTGATALEEFEITGNDALIAASNAWAAQEESDRRLWKGRPFVDPNHPEQPTRMTRATMREINLALLWLPTDRANAFWAAFIAERARIREQMGYATEARTKALRGEVLRTTQVASDLTLYEVKNEAGHRFGILQGVVMGKMPRLREHLYDADGKVQRSYINFTAGERVVSGLEIPWTRIKGVAAEFGTSLQAEAIRTPAQASAAMKAGDTLTLGHRSDGSARSWELRQRKDEKIVIDGAKMADRALLLRHGADYSPVGNFWFVSDLAKFLERFPVAAAPQPKAARKTEGGGSTLQMAIIPGLKEFLEGDVTPAAQELARMVKDSADGLQILFAPATVSAEGERGAGVLRASVAGLWQKAQRARKTMADAIKYLDRQYVRQAADGDATARERFLVFADAMEGIRPLDDVQDAVERAVATWARRTLDGRREVAIKLGLMQNYLEHYFPHEWKDADSAKKLFGRRPLQGPESYRRKRTIPTVREGVERGLEPASWNPVDLVLRKLLEMDKSIMARRFMRTEGKRAGIVKYVSVGKRPPEDWVRYPESIGTVYGPRVEQQTFGRVVTGQYYGPKDAVRILERYLSPGLSGRVAAFDLFRTLSNTFVQLKLALSVFHGLTTGLESVVSKTDLALQLASRGEWKEAAKAMAEIPIAPIADIIRGHRWLREFYDSDAQTRAINGVVQEVVQAGGGFGWDLFEHSEAPERFMEALRKGNYPGATWRAIPALIELQAVPIMKWWVPRLKMAAFRERARMELRSLGPNPDLNEVRRVLGQQWDTIDDRFGQIIYRNWFWFNAMKEIGQASMLSLGWNGGSLRLMGGAIPGQLARVGLIPSSGGRGGFGKRPTRRVNTGRGPTGERVYQDVEEPWLHYRMAWLMSLMVVGGLINAMYQYLLTGEMPHDPKDVVMPRNGRTNEDGSPQRVFLPGYMKDVLAWTSHPFVTATHKVNPFIRYIIESVENTDYRGVQYRNEDDPAAVQFKDWLAFTLKEMEPISTERAAQSGVESYLGINPAPRDLTQTTAEAKLSEIQDRRGHPTLTQRQGEARDARTALRRGLASGTPEGRVAAEEAIRSRLLTRRQIQNARTGASETYLQRGFPSLTLDEALEVYTVASPQERQSVYRELVTKSRRFNRGQAGAADTVARLNKALRLPRAAATPAKAAK